MSDLIDREAAIEAISECEPGEELFVIESLPSIEVNQKTGEWSKTTITSEDKVSVFYECSNCLFSFPKVSVTTNEIVFYQMDRFNFCPNCGADMRKKEKN